MWCRLNARTDWHIAFAITAVLRMIYTGVAAAAAWFVHPNALSIQSNVLTESLPTPGNWHYALLGIWQRFDTLWYLRIAEKGYDLPAAVVFYPLYPWLIGILSGMVGAIGAALLISTVSAFFYFWGLLRLARTESPNVPPLQIALLTAAWPASFFFFAGYTEALAVALIVWCVRWAREERWILAAACAFAAGLTRSAGTLAVVPLIILAWRAPRRSRWPVALAPLGTVGYWFWLHKTGHLSIASAYRIYWSTEVSVPLATVWQAIRFLVENPDILVFISLLSLILFLVAGVSARRRIEDRCFATAAILHPLLRMCWPPLLGTPRYMLPVYPAYLTMGQWTEKMPRTYFAFVCATLFTFNLAWMWAFLRWSMVL
jgi:hypothetical protein